MGTPGNNLLFSVLFQTSKEVKEHLSNLGLSSKHNLATFKIFCRQCSALVYALSLYV